MRFGIRETALVAALTLLGACNCGGTSNTNKPDAGAHPDAGGGDAGGADAGGKDGGGTDAGGGDAGGGDAGAADAAWDAGPDAPPTVKITSPTAPFVKGQVTFSADATDDHGVVKVTFMVDSASIGEVTTPPYQVTWDTDQATEGGHTITAVAIDAANQAATDVKTPKVDRASPTISITAPLDGATVPPAFDVITNAADTNLVDHVDFFVDGQAVGTVTSPPFQLRTQRIAPGAHTLDATAVDGASNSAQATTVNVTVDCAAAGGTCCQTDAQCTTAGALHCDPAAHLCVECVSTSQCTNGDVCVNDRCKPPAQCQSNTDCRAPTAVCDLGPTPHVCVECLTQQDCPAFSTCDGSHSCVPEPTCAGPSDCTDPAKPVCDATQHCAPCSATNACPSNKVCELGTGACVDCLQNTDCTDAANPQCNPTTHVCEHCSSDNGCTADPSLPRCEVTSGACVECVTNPDCAASTNGPVCNPTGHVCVQCVTDLDCGGATPHCEPTYNICVQCLNNTQCTPPTSVCDTSTDNTCVVCASDADCKGFTAYCDTTTRAACVECLTDYNCFPTGVCDTAGAYTCHSGNPCSAGYDCNSGVCSATSTCVQCNTSADCPSAKQTCDAAGVCQDPAACTATGDCTSNHLCLGGICIADTCVADSHEPNDYPLDAVRLTPGAAITGLTACVNNPDFFVFPATGADGATVTVTTADDLYVLLVYWDQNYNQIQVPGLRHGGDIIVRAGALSAAVSNEYFVLVTDRGVKGSYTIRVDLGTQSCTDSGEPNDTSATAVTLRANEFATSLQLCGDDDWYSVTLPAQQRLNAFLLLPIGETATAEVYNAAGTTLLGTLALATDPGFDYSANGFDTWELPGPLARTTVTTTYLVKVSGGTVGTQYALYPAAGPDGALCASAQVIALDPTTHKASLKFNTFTDGHNQAGSCASAGPQSIYRVTAAAGDVVLATVTTAQAGSVYIRRATCSTGTEVGACTLTDGTSAQAYAPNVTAGTYFIIVSDQNAGEHMQGTLDVYVGPPTPGDFCPPTLPITLDGTLHGTVTGTTANAINDINMADTGCTGYATPGADVYYSLTLAAGQAVQVTLTPDPAYDAALYAVSSCSATACVAGSDSGSSGGDEVILLSAPASPATTTFYIGVDSWRAGTEGPFTLTVDAAPAGSQGDTCGYPNVLAVPSTATGDTTPLAGNYAFPNGGTGCGSLSHLYTANDAAYLMTVNAGQTVTLTLTPGDPAYDAVLYLLQPDCGDVTLNCKDGADANGGGGVETLTVTNSGGTAVTYYVIVDGYGSEGPYTLQAQ
jgi:hypothetical protein